jgi:hypothetical protein
MANGRTGTKSHHFTHPILTHDWSFLEGNKKHTHTLKAGRHTFPFSFSLDGNLPSSIKTYTNDASIGYKLRVHVVRSGLASNYQNVKTFTLARTFTNEALEFNQTLEIENTWPGKVMYSLTLPHKAYAAGDDIPVSIKFMPLAKGVRILSVSSVVKEYTLVHTRHSSHPDARVAASVKHELVGGKAYEVAEGTTRAAPAVPSQESSRAHSTVASRLSSPSRTPMPLPSQLPADNWAARPPDSFFPAQAGPSNAVAGSSTSTHSTASEDVEIGDDEINTSLSIAIPAWTTPSHSIHPVFVTHKIKWSCSISNPDGHVSELRCALPICIIDNSLLSEARAAGANTRALLFGGAAAEEAQQVDLPSYNNHVYDRIAVADSGTATSFMPRSLQATPMGSPASATPPHSRPPSRPGSPNRGMSTNDDVPPRRQLSQWADSELLLSLGALSSGSNSRAHSHENSPGETPPDSRGPSRPQSRAGGRSGRSSNAGSRAGSRASSPERPATAGQEDGLHRPVPERRGSGFHNLLHLPASLKPMRPLSSIGTKGPILRANTHGPQANNGLARNAFSFANLPGQSTPGGSSNVSFAPNTAFNTTHNEPRRTRFQVGGENDQDDIDPISQVPSYAVASRGFLGGGIVPLSVELPTYVEAERLVERTRSAADLTVPRPRSETALAGMAHEAEEGQGEDVIDMLRR